MSEKYCPSVHAYQRFITREVTIGSLKMGAHHPIRVQSMTTTDTMNTDATVAQSIRMIEAGCELVRITAPSVNEAKNLENIRKSLKAAGFETPICADIHFTPNAAEWAARLVEKVRINPGNYADKKKFEHINYTDSTYEAELDRIRERFIPLIRICKEYGTAMRIGTNHGSLSDRILSRYGDTPLGMVESAMEFLRICEAENYHNIVLSMKASNTQVMVQAYRLLVQKMMLQGQNYPLHLGVTEAGDGEDGRIKSAVGIGTLLEDGLGDTIRVSLTEEPEFEIPVAKALAERYQKRPASPIQNPQAIPDTFSPFEYSRRETNTIHLVGHTQVPRVVANLSHKTEIKTSHLFALGYHYDAVSDKWNLNDQAVDYIYSGKQTIAFNLPGTLGIICDADMWNPSLSQHFPLFTKETFFTSSNHHPELNFIQISADHISSITEIAKNNSNIALIISGSHSHRMAELRNALFYLQHQAITCPVIFRIAYSETEKDIFQLYASTDFGGLFIDGFGDGIWIDKPSEISNDLMNSTAFGILQATRTRISKTEYISCPSCGRTLFDLQETTAKIRAVTYHLKGVKIGIMGCIVNGPGEMADADYGYVGTGPDKISLYKGKEVVKKNVHSDEAVQELIQLIKEHGDWTEPVVHSPLPDSPHVN